MAFDNFNINIAIVGLGLIGGSYAKALKKLNPKCLIGIDKNKEYLNVALDEHIIDRAYYNSSKEALKDADLVIIALYPKETQSFIKSNIDNFKNGAIVTDVCGIKNDIINTFNLFGKNNFDFIGGHPMAGLESSGFLNSDPNIFKGANYILTPTGKNSKENIDFLEKIAYEIGFLNVLKISPKTHDDIIAYTSQLPHVISVALMRNANFDSDIKKLIGPSFNDLTRVSNINADLWSEIFISNHSSIIYEIEKFEESIKELKNAIISKDKILLNSILSEATDKRKKMI